MLWVAEGLLSYLTQDSIVDLLELAARSSAPGSQFLADVTGTTGLDSPTVRPYLDWCVLTGAPPPFGHDDQVALVAAGGWSVDALCTPGAPEANHGRLAVAPPWLVTGRIHFVRAVASA